jgi:hypothetical protein
MKSACVLLALVAGFTLFTGCATGPKVEFLKAENKIDIMVGGKLATRYLYGSELTKPILYPLCTPSGFKLNRGFPLEKVEGESEDHPHHTGLFFTYDQVNGAGFWNNTTSPPQIKHVETVDMDGGTGEGTLSVVHHWVNKEGQVLLEERRDMVFSESMEEHVIDFDITLEAQEEKVVFEDTKEGMFGIRVAHWLKEKGGTGRYLSSNGDETEQHVWGKRAAWVRLEGKKDGKTLGIAILNHPSSVNYPTFWHARSYGLFAANPLGQHVFETSRKAAEPKAFTLTLSPGEEASFRFRVILYEGPRTKGQIENRFKTYTN